MELYPLTFVPVFRQYIWGGRRLGEVLGKPIGPEPRYAESWEVVDHGEDQSVVAEGPLAGRTLGALLDQFGAALWAGGAKPFPLLLKYLDCNRVLSVQVHPDDAYGATMDPPDLGKTEAWYVIDAEPESVIYAGLKQGVDRERFAAAIRSGEVADVLHTLRPRAGDCIFIPAGTVHALGAGILVAEIQQSSDTTFRVFDWNRLDDSGNPRPLHVEQALEVTDYERGEVAPQIPQPLGDGGERLVACDKFVLDRYTGVEARQLATAGGRILTAVQGEGTLRWSGGGAHGGGTVAMPRGQSVLVPAALSAVQFEPHPAGATLLSMGSGGSAS
ncbi:type I phosphomannose isomerase catalytic subunit [Candidatus Laterigemmans baculatus]|uniref:type I phosphomannose isomerase catalytic subunit n=1 Tax=Candidatus Laterigemmans baculatus TaxID=2770505 RepID=UPI0013DD259A|nr:type I phosphomannose isomerase catalytic subunit [Candidatus Laterigemmans baculatus]